MKISAFGLFSWQSATISWILRCISALCMPSATEVPVGRSVSTP